MAIALITTPGLELSNSYISLEAMATYVSEQVVSEAAQAAWDQLEAERQALYLTKASKYLDSLVEWTGDRYFQNQSMGWPRSNAWVDGRYLDPQLIPARVAEAAAEMALWMAVQSGAASVDNANAQFNEVEVGPLRINFNTESAGSAKKYFPDEVAILLRGYGDISNPQLPGSGQAHTVRLVRS